MVTWIVFLVVCAGIVNYAVKGIKQRRKERGERTHQPHGMDISYDQGAIARSISEGRNHEGGSAGGGHQ